MAILAKAEESMVFVSCVWTPDLVNCYQELQSKLMAAAVMVMSGLFGLVVLLFHNYHALMFYINDLAMKTMVQYPGHNEFG